jgi:hypothetical protein
MNLGRITDEELKHLDDLLFKVCHDEDFPMEEVKKYQVQLFKKYKMDPDKIGIDAYYGTFVRLYSKH